MVGKKKTAPLDAKLADKLLDLLSSDDKFRALFQADPGSALAQIGYSAPVLKSQATLDSAQPSFAACARVAQLASKEVIQEARAEIKSMMLDGLAYTTPQLDAARTAE